MRKQRNISISGIFLAMLIGYGLPVAQSAEMTPFQVKLVQDQVLPAYWDGQPVDLVNACSQLVATVRTDTTAIDQALRDETGRTLQELVVDGRMQLIRSRFAGPLAVPSEREVLWVLDAILQDHSAVIQKINASPAMQQDRVDSVTSLPDLEDMLWKLHVIGNQILTARQESDQAIASARLSLNRLAAEQADARRQAVAKFEALQPQFDSLEKRSQQQQLRFRIKRIEIAEHLLRSRSSLAEQIEAAWIADSDGPLVAQQLEKIGLEANLPSDEFASSQLRGKVISQVRRIRELAGDERMEKSRLFYDGLHWWLRGRYGAGAYGFGLLKDMRAMTSPEVLFALYMPQEMPIPTAPNESSLPIPEVDRRHHYVWMYEYRRAFRTEGSKSTERTIARQDKRERVQLPRFY
ncbi:MAG: hypothetical protein R3C28_16595 [Pirellulaceae bacterium]